MNPLGEILRVCCRRAWEGWYRIWEQKLQGHESEARAICADTLKTLDRALSLAPDDPEALYLHGVLLDLEDRNGEAMAAFQSALTAANGAIDRRPDDADGHLWRGKVLAGRRHPRAALAALRRAAELDPGLAEAHLGEAGVLQGLGQYEAALEAYDRALAQLPLNDPKSRYQGAVAYYQKADILWRHLRRYPDALHACARVIELEPPFLNEAESWRDEIFRQITQPDD